MNAITPIRATLLLALAQGAALACTPSPQTDSKSNWYSLCETSEDCSGSLSCACGICAPSCSSDDDCSEPGARCAASESAVTCFSSAAASIGDAGAGGAGLVASSSSNVCLAGCSDSAECPANSLCVAGLCVRETQELAPVCETEWAPRDRDFELAAMQHLNERREDLSFCGQMSITPLSSLLLDFRLRCAARNQSKAMAESGVLLGETPDGVNYAQRIADAGYQASIVKIIYGIGSDLTRMDEVADKYCTDLVDERVSEIGVGQYGEYFTILLSSESAF